MNKQITGFSTYTAEVAGERKITADKITNLFGTCLLKETDFNEEGLSCGFLIGDGISGRAVFSADRLNEHREEINDYIGQLQDIDHAPSFMQLYYDSMGEQWTDAPEVVDKLVQLGMASKMLFFTFPEQLWPYLPGGVPGVGKQIYDHTKSVNGMKAKEYVKIFGENK